MTATLPLGPDDLLSTTRAVRKRLDFDRPVDLDLVRECIALAAQAPTGSNSQGWRFVVVTDAAKRARLGELYKDAFESVYINGPGAAGRATGDPERDAAQARVLDSAVYLAENLGRAPVHVIPCIYGRMDGLPSAAQAGLWGSIIPAAWSFCLAARSRGLGTAWTTLHLMHEQEAAELLGIPFDKVTQAALLPVAHTVGTDFKPGPRRPLDQIVRIDGW